MSYTTMGAAALEEIRQGSPDGAADLERWEDLGRERDEELHMKARELREGMVVVVVRTNEIVVVQRIVGPVVECRHEPGGLTNVYTPEQLTETKP